MPWIESSLPFSGSVPQSAHSSRAGAEDAAPRALNQTVRYLALLKVHGGLTDWEAHELMHLERTTITARRRPLVVAGLVYSDGHRDGPTGVKNTIWKAA